MDYVLLNEDLKPFTEVKSIKSVDTIPDEYWNSWCRHFAKLVHKMAFNIKTSIHQDRKAYFESVGSSFIHNIRTIHTIEPDADREDLSIPINNSNKFEQARDLFLKNSPDSTIIKQETAGKKENNNREVSWVTLRADTGADALNISIHSISERNPIMHKAELLVIPMHAVARMFERQDKKESILHDNIEKTLNQNSQLVLDTIIEIIDPAINAFSITKQLTTKPTEISIITKKGVAGISRDPTGAAFGIVKTWLDDDTFTHIKKETVQDLRKLNYKYIFEDWFNFYLIKPDITSFQRVSEIQKYQKKRPTTSQKKRNKIYTEK